MNGSGIWLFYRTVRYTTLWRKIVIKFARPLLITGVVAMLAACAPNPPPVASAPPPPPPPMAMAAPAPEQPYVAPPMVRRHYAHRWHRRHYHVHHHYVHHVRHRVHKAKMK
jgi:hypothetical protein